MKPPTFTVEELICALLKHDMGAPVVFADGSDGGATRIAGGVSTEHYSEDRLGRGMLGIAGPRVVVLWAK